MRYLPKIKPLASVLLFYFFISLFGCAGSPERKNPLAGLSSSQYKDSQQLAERASQGDPYLMKFLASNYSNNGYGDYPYDRDEARKWAKRVVASKASDFKHYPPHHQQWQEESRKILAQLDEEERIGLPAQLPRWSLTYLKSGYDALEWSTDHLDASEVRVPGKEISLHKAIESFQVSAGYGHPVAMYELAKLMSGEGSVFYLQKSANIGYLPAKALLDQKLTNGELSKSDLRLSAYISEDSLRKLNDAYMSVAQSVKNGMPQVNSHSLRGLNELERIGYPEAIYVLAKYTPIRPNREKHLRRAAELGYVPAMLKLAESLAEGAEIEGHPREGIEKNIDEAEIWAKKAYAEYPEQAQVVLDGVAKERAQIQAEKDAELEARTSDCEFIHTLERQKWMYIAKENQVKAYKGECKDGLAHGKGKITEEGGRIFEGEFYKGYHHGYGVYIDRVSRFEGKFEMGSREGIWKYTKNGRTEEYEYENNINLTNIGKPMWYEGSKQAAKDYEMYMKYTGFKGHPENETLAKEYLIKSAYGGHEMAIHTLADGHREGLSGFPRDYETARYWAKKGLAIPAIFHDFNRMLSWINEQDQNKRDYEESQRREADRKQRLKDEKEQQAREREYAIREKEELARLEDEQRKARTRRAANEEQTAEEKAFERLLQGGSILGSGMAVDDPLNPNNPINRNMQEQVNRNLSQHYQKQEQAKRDYEAEVAKRQREIEAQKEAKRRNISYQSDSTSGLSGPGSTRYSTPTSTHDQFMTSVTEDEYATGRDGWDCTKQWRADKCGERMTTHTIHWQGRNVTDGQGNYTNIPMGSDDSHSSNNSNAGGTGSSSGSGNTVYSGSDEYGENGEGGGAQDPGAGESVPVNPPKQLIGDSEYYYREEMSMDLAQTDLMNQANKYCGTAYKTRLDWHDTLTDCKQLGKEYRCKVHATVTCLAESCGSPYCGTKR